VTASGPADPFRLDGLVAVITGAGKGIGAAIARSYAAAGADVALTARTASDLEEVAGAVRALGRRAHVLPGDVNDRGVVAQLVDTTVGELGRLDIVVNNAGGSVSHPFLDTTVEQLEHSFHFNISVPFELSRLAVPHMLERGGGVIVNIGSVAGRKAVRGTLAHSLTKAAMAQLTRLMAADLAPRVRVNAVCPGYVLTPMQRAEYTDEMLAEVDAGIPLGRHASPEEIAALYAFLASDEGAYFTGATISIDGGETA
jgi:7-alpha-hydroxysteroid dehydrogenase